MVGVPLAPKLCSSRSGFGCGGGVSLDGAGAGGLAPSMSCLLPTGVLDTWSGSCGNTASGTGHEGQLFKLCPKAAFIRSFEQPFSLELALSIAPVRFH